MTHSPSKGVAKLTMQIVQRRPRHRRSKFGEQSAQPDNQQIPSPIQLRLHGRQLPPPKMRRPEHHLRLRRFRLLRQQQRSSNHQLCEQNHHSKLRPPVGVCQAGHQRFQQCCDVLFAEPFQRMADHDVSAQILRSHERDAEVCH